MCVAEPEDAGISAGVRMVLSTKHDRSGGVVSGAGGVATDKAWMKQQ